MKQPRVFDRIISLRLTAAQIAAIAAARGGLSQADFIRAAIAACLPPAPAMEKDDAR